MGFIPFMFAWFSSWFSILVVVVCISFIILLTSLLIFSRADDSSLQVQSIDLLISSLASSHMLNILSAACLVCLVVSSIISVMCLVRSRRGLILFMTEMAVSSALWLVAPSSSRVVMALIPLGSMLGGAQ